MESWIRWAIGIFISILLASTGLLLNYANVTGYFDHPLIVPVTQIGSEKVCPPNLTFWKDASTGFSLKWKNTGDADANVQVNVESPDLKFAEQSKSWLLENDVDREQEYSFIILNEYKFFETTSHFTISYNYEYEDNKKTVSSQMFNCTYNKREVKKVYQIQEFDLVS